MPLRVAFSWTLMGYLGYAGCQWGIVAALAKLGTPEMVGQYALGLTVTAPIVLFCNLQLRSVQVTDTRGQYGFGDYLGLRLLTSLAAIAAVVALVAGGRFSRPIAGVILATALAKAIDAVGDTYGGLFQQQERMDRAALSQALRGVSALAALTAVVAATHDLLAGILATALTSALVLVLFDMPNGRAVLAASTAPRDERASAAVPRWRWPALMTLARIGLPLGTLTLLLSLNSSVPSYVIGQMLGQAPLGIFAALAFLTLVPLTVVNALGQSASRRLAQSFVAGDRSGFVTLTARLVLLATALSLAALIAAAAIGRPALTLLYTPAYGAQTPLFVWLMAGSVLACLASVLGVALTATRCFTPQLPLGVLVTALTLGLCLWLVPRWGLTGAAWGVILSAAVQSVGIGILLARRLAAAVPNPSTRPGDTARSPIAGTTW